MEETSEEGEMKQVSRKKTKQAKNKQGCVDSEMDEPINPTAYDGEILDIDKEVDQRNPP